MGVAEGAEVLSVNGYSQQTRQLLDLLIKEGVDADKLEIVGAINKMLTAVDGDGEPNFEVMERGIQLAQQLKDSVHGKHLKIVEKAADHQVRLLEVQNKKTGRGGVDPAGWGFTGLDGEG